MKKTILLAAVAAVVALTAITAKAQSTIIGGYPVFSGQFQHQGPLGDNLTNATFGGTTTFNGPLSLNGQPLSSATNTAALSRISNPLTSGAQYTTPTAQGFVRVNVLCTNTANAWLTNYTTGDAVTLGTLTGAVSTNYLNAIIRTGPADIVGLTNITGTLPIVSSEWRN